MRRYSFFFIIVIGLSLVASDESLAQIRFGPKIAVQANIPVYKDAVLNESISPVVWPGFNVGLAMDYNATKTFSFYTELVYSYKTKKLTGGIKDMFQHVAKYSYLELPAMLRVNFNSANRKEVSWFIGAGGVFSYWLSGKGVINSFELDELALSAITYKINYKPLADGETDPEFMIHLEEPNRMQVGLTIDGGIAFDVKRRQDMMVSLRYDYRQSWLAADYDVDVGLGEYQEDFRTREHSLSITATYMFEWNLGEGRQGKSTVKKRKTR